MLIKLSATNQRRISQSSGLFLTAVSIERQRKLALSASRWLGWWW